MTDPHGGEAAPEPGADTLDHDLPVLDERPLLVLQEIVSVDSFAGLLGGWFTSLAARIEHLVGAAAAGDLRALRETAHDMSGTCGCFGALRLGELAWELELMCRTGDLDRVRALVRRMVPITAATRAALRRRYFSH